MSAPNAEGELKSKTRSIEIALDSLKSRMQGVITSHLSSVNEKLERIRFRINSGAARTPSAESGELELRKTIDEIKSILEKDLMKDTLQLLHEKLTEFDELISRLGRVLTQTSASQQPQRPITQPPRVSTPSGSSGSPDEKDKEIASLREEVNRLYNLTEREPRFQAFWILRDAYPNWVQIAKIARTLDTAPVQVHENLKTFEDLGLVEVRGGDARAVKLVRPTKPITDVRKL